MTEWQTRLFADKRFMLVKAVGIVTMLRTPIEPALYKVLIYDWSCFLGSQYFATERFNSLTNIAP